MDNQKEDRAHLPPLLDDEAFTALMEAGNREERAGATPEDISRAKRSKEAVAQRLAARGINVSPGTTEASASSAEHHLGNEHRQVTPPTKLTLGAGETRRKKWSPAWAGLGIVAAATLFFVLKPKAPLDTDFDADWQARSGSVGGLARMEGVAGQAYLMVKIEAPPTFVSLVKVEGDVATPLNPYVRFDAVGESRVDVPADVPSGSRVCLLSALSEASIQALNERASDVVSVSPDCFAVP